MAAQLRGRRVPWADLRVAALGRDSSLLGDPDQRERLRAAVDELVAAGLVELPAPGGRSWDRGRIDLPLWVQRVANRESAPEPPRAPAWHVRLSWVPHFLATERRGLSENEWLLLRGVQEMLAGGVATHVVPTRERSLDLLGDEKLLDRMLSGRLFTRGGLSLALLQARQVARPITTGAIGPGPVTLIVENVATYDSLSRTLPPDGEVGRLVFGQGNDLGSALSALAAEPEPVRDLRYFGDLDPAGVRIPSRVDTAARGLPPLRPAARLYRLLLQVGHPRPGGSGAADLDWLPEEVRPRVAALFGAGERLAQEWLGLEQLAHEDLSRV
ncbi:hypothetical protein [Pseudonocardia sp. WMMC193]|uniref:hypothetical protein n=1 Tax=Pseudonocardia sp. WMMC193 TaxID=2911965 RepID=UPI001F363E17|nr:hypothetical protein [Pseudonocardia sp. WMMC193]MCF7549780.1 hypothetical protein [Pseudonocardia sp. WMMC193]